MIQTYPELGWEAEWEPGVNLRSVMKGEGHVDVVDVPVSICTGCPTLIVARRRFIVPMVWKGLP